MAAIGHERAGGTAWGTPTGAYTQAIQSAGLRACLPVLDRLNQRLAQGIAVGLSDTLNKLCTVRSEPAVAEHFVDFTRHQENPSYIELIGMQPLPGTAVFVCDPKLIALVIDILFGGDGRFVDRMRRFDFTPTEKRIVDSLFGVLLDALARAWSAFCDLRPIRLGTDTHPGLAQITTADDWVASSRLILAIEGIEVTLAICLPASTLEPLRDPLRALRRALAPDPERRWSDLLARHLQTVEVELSYTLGSAQLTLGEVLDLRAGDIIPIESHQVGMACIEGVPLIACRHGTLNGHYALKIDAFSPPDQIPPATHDGR
ncbi:MAG: hypothetical protein EOM91_09285 [Sphingobacteriia bacterium]|nr:hypothetical protein [Sphingobacteriia bacterium]NCC39008.1 hypothetical protein [Gammaproteobacteria bacterium]